jgi:MtN3 and saliva related transmembrane protein
MLNKVEILGIVASIVGITSILPQMIKVISTRKTRDLSLWMWVLVCISTFAWLIHGIIYLSPAIILSNSIILPTSLVITIYKIKFG